MTTNSDDAIREQLRHTYDLFADIRAKFDGPGVERGGHLRAGFTPVYIKKFGAYADAILQGVKHYSVEASFSDEQLAHINAATVALRRHVVGVAPAPGMAERVVEQFLHGAHGYFLLAMLRATEDVLRELVRAEPQLVASLDALFRVAGGEGFRDLIHFYGAHLLEHAVKSTTAPAPDLLAFVNVHDCMRRDQSGVLAHMKYEVWCPGNDLARLYFGQCQAAAEALVRRHGLRSPFPLPEELGVLPMEISGHLTDFVQRLAQPILRQHGIV
jgi:hypothetical protein